MNLNSMQPRNRRGTVYIAVLGVTLIVAVMASVAVSVVRIERRVDATYADQQTARVLAQTGVEFGTNWMANNTAWRTALVSGVEGPLRSMNGGTYTWKVADADGDLNDDLRDGVELCGIGRVGDAVVVEQVELMPAGDALACLEPALQTQAEILV